MNATIGFVREHWLAGGTGILGWGIGFFTDIWKEGHRLKLRRREAHAQEIQEEILRPLLTHLRDFYLPVCRKEMSPLVVETKQIYRDDANSVAEDAYLRTEHRIEIKPPALLPHLTYNIPDTYRRWLETEGFQRFFSDALGHHYPELLKKWEMFKEEYNTTAEMAKTKVESLIPHLQKSIGLPVALAGVRGQEPLFRANYQRLALMVFHRQNGIARDGLLPDYGVEIESGGGKILVIRDIFNQNIVWCGEPQDQERIINIIDEMIKKADPDDIAARKAQFEKLAIVAQKLIKEIDSALAKKPVLKKCPMV